MTKKNYIQTLKSFEPQRLFTFSSINSFINYDGRELIGAIFDENTSAILTPVLTYLQGAPKEINLFGPSVIANEKENQSLAISGASKLTPYNVAYTSLSPETEPYVSGSVSVQFEVPKQTLNNETVIEEYTTPIAVITADTGEVVKLTSTLFADNWHLPIEMHHFPNATEITVSMSYKNRVFSTNTYTLESPEVYVKRFEKPADIYNNPTSDKFPDYRTDMPVLPNTADVPATLVWGYGLVDGKMIYMIHVTDFEDVEIEGVITSVPVEKDVLYTKDTLILYGKIKERIDITKYSTNTKGGGIQANRMTDVLSIGSLRLSVFYNSGSSTLQLQLENKGTTEEGFEANTFRTFNIAVDTSYTLVITHERSTRLEGIYDTKCYINGAIVFNGEMYTEESFTNSSLRIGTSDTIRTASFSVGPHNFWMGAYLTYHHNNVTIFIDNVAVISHQISARDIYLMYIRTMTYTQLLLSFKPYYHTVFDKLTNTYKNQFGTDRLEVKNFSTSAVNIDSEVYEVGTRFKGIGSLIHKAQSTNNSDTTSMVDFNSPFSIVFWLSTTNRKFLLFSERNKSNYESGLSIFIEDGFVTYLYGETKYKTSCFIADGQFKMLCMTYDGNNIKTFIPKEHSSQKPATLSNNGIYPRYVTLLNDKGIHADVDVVLCAFTVFSIPLDTQQFTDLYNESIDFSVVGTVLYKNLPAYATVRIIEHSTGILLDTQYTDSEGVFKYTSIYKNDIDLITLNNGRIQVLGTLQSTTR